MKPEATEETSNEQATNETAQSASPVEDGHNANTKAVDGATENEASPQAGGDKAEQVVTTNFDLPGHDTHGSLTIDAAIPRLDSLLVKSAFEKLKTADQEIQAGIVEAVARQLEVDEATAAEVAEVAPGAVGSAMQDIPEVVDPVVVEMIAAHEEIAPVLQESMAEESVTDVSEPAAQDVEAEAARLATQEAVANEALETPIPTSTSEETATPTAVVSETGHSETEAPDTNTPKAASVHADFGDASPEELAALMAYLQKLKKDKTAGPTQAAAPQTTISEAPSIQEDVASSAVENTVSESSSAETVASMTEPIEPSGEAPEAPQPIETISFKTTVPDAVVSEDVEPGPSTSDRISGYAAMLDAVTTDAGAAARKSAPSEPAEKAESRTNDVDSALDEELERKLGAAEKGDGAMSTELNAKDKQPRLPRNVQAYYLQPLRRVAQYGVPSCDLQLRSYSVRPLESFCDFALRAAYYLGLPAYGPTPLPKIIERWTVPKSSFIFKKSQENFERITRRRLIQIKDGHPETVQIWLAFLQKHQQAAVGLKANMWEFSSLGKSTTGFANDWCSGANNATDVAKEMNKALEEAEPLLKDKFRLLAQKKEFATVEKVDEFLQSERYRLTGGQYTGGW